MTKYITTILFVLMLVFGAKAEALSYVPSSGWQYCPNLTYDLMLGAQDSWTGSQVSQLQMFLAQDRSVYPSGLVTGYFGYNTQQAVQNFQMRYGLTNAWSAAYGVVGPQTRSTIRSLCSNTYPYPQNPNPGYCTLEYNPVCGQKTECSCSQYYSGIPCTGCYLTQKTYSNTCMMNNDGAQLLHYGACNGTGSYSNKPPTISSFSGPTTLDVNETGTWTIRAQDPENGQLTYSVQWGDQLYYANSAAYTTQNSFTQTTSVQHVYTQPGTYTITITVRDSAGQAVTSSTTVRVDKVHYPYPVWQWPQYYDYNNYYNSGYYDNYYYGNYYDTYYYDYNWYQQNPYGWGNTYDWNYNYNNNWDWIY